MRWVCGPGRDRSPLDVHAAPKAPHGAAAAAAISQLHGGACGRVRLAMPPPGHAQPSALGYGAAVLIPQLGPGHPRFGFGHYL